MKQRKMGFLILSAVVLAVIVYAAYPGKMLPKGTVVDRVEVFKSERKMLVYSDSQLLKTYRIALGANPVGTKEFEGDMKTPEGNYTINAKNPNGGYHKNLGVSYPDAKDIAFAEKLGKPAGGDIKIHGLRNGSGLIGKFHRLKDWTHGCMAVTDAEIDELYESVPIGTPIAIYP